MGDNGGPEVTRGHVAEACYVVSGALTAWRTSNLDVSGLRC